MKNKNNDSFDDFFENLFSKAFLIGSFKLGSFGFNDDEDSSFPKDGDENYHKTEEVTETSSHSIKKEIWTSLDGTQSFQRTTSQSKKTERALSEEKIKELRDEAVAEHRYEDAAKYRDQLLKLKTDK